MLSSEGVYLMKKRARIYVIGRQKDLLGEEDTITHDLIGQLYCKNKAYYIIYKEPAESGMEGTTTTIKADGKQVTINRMGTSQMKQVFEEGRNYRGIYITPYGNMDLEVHPNQVEVHLTESGGSINLKYELIIGSEKVSSNSLQITVEEDLD